MKLVFICSVLAVALARPQTLDEALAAHQAALDRVLASQGRAPGSIVSRVSHVSHAQALAAHTAAEEALKATAVQEASKEAARIAAAPARSVVSDTGNIGPSGIVGASGNIGPSGLCGPSGCVAFGFNAFGR